MPRVGQTGRGGSDAKSLYRSNECGGLEKGKAQLLIIK